MFQIPFFIRDFPDHEKHKYKILSLIMEHDSRSIHNESIEKISLTDWKVNTNKRQKYADYVINILDKDIKSLLRNMKYDRIRYQGIWFQQYNKTDYHTWHRHGSSEWNLVYYLEFAKDCPATEFRNPVDPEETFIPDVREGQYILFPSLLAHRSAPNPSRERKTVIAINITTNNYLLP